MKFKFLVENYGWCNYWDYPNKAMYTEDYRFKGQVLIERRAQNCPWDVPAVYWIVYEAELVPNDEV